MVKTKYLFIRRNIEFGGCEHTLLDWIRRIDYSKADVTILLRYDLLSPHLDLDSCPVTIREIVPDFPFSLENLKGWFRLLKDISPRTIILMNGGFFDFPLYIVILAKLMSKGVLVMVENSVAAPPPLKSSKRHFKLIPGLGIWWYREVLPWRTRAWWANHLFAISRKVKDRLVEWGYPEKKIGILRLGVDLVSFRPSREERDLMRKTLEFSDEDTLLMCTSRLSPEKGVDRLIRVFNRLSKEFDHLELVIAGDGPEREKLEELAGDNESVRFLGEITREEVSSVLKGSDIFILPSAEEGLGLALLEGMATGLVCIATKGSGPDDIIKNGENGFLVSHEEEDMTMTLKRVLETSPEQLESLRTFAVKTVADNYSLRENVPRILGELGIPHA